MAPAGLKCLLHDMNDPITRYKTEKWHQTALKKTCQILISSTPFRQEKQMQFRPIATFLQILYERVRIAIITVGRWIITPFGHQKIDHHITSLPCCYSTITLLYFPFQLSLCSSLLTTNPLCANSANTEYGRIWRDICADSANSANGRIWRDVDKGRVINGLTSGTGYTCKYPSTSSLSPFLIGFSINVRSNLYFTKSGSWKDFSVSSVSAQWLCFAAHYT